MCAGDWQQVCNGGGGASVATGVHSMAVVPAQATFHMLACKAPANGKFMLGDASDQMDGMQCSARPVAPAACDLQQLCKGGY